MKRTPSPSGPSQRQLRVGELVRHAVTELLARGELPDPVFARAFVTIPEVRMSPDLKVATALRTAIDTAFVGPLMSCFDESSRAPTAVITMAVYNPYCGGIPAIWAYAIAWGNATAATVSPAITSQDKSCHV